MMSEERGRPLPTPKLTWEAGQPVSARFNDIYYSRAGGLLESRHVFLGGNELPGAWQGKSVFCIAELGFGTGLNFLATWELWQRSRTPGTRLHYMAVEGYPLSHGDLRQALAPWEDLKALSGALISSYPESQRGFHRVFPMLPGAEGSELALTFLFGDAAAMLAQLEADVDAWFLDGFSPDKNPDMWSERVFAEMARLSGPGASVATYSVAGGVRRGLEAAGFETSRAQGFGSKREMLRARRRPRAVREGAVPPWFARAPLGAAAKHAAIIGAGLAGTQAAAALARRGWRTTIVDRRAAPGAEASAVPRAAMAPRLTAAPSLDGRFYAAAWRFALNALAAAREQIGHACGGSLQLAAPDETERLAAVAVSGTLPPQFVSYLTATEASEIAGMKISRGGLFFPQGGSIPPHDICAFFAARSDMRLEAEVARLDNTNGSWRLFDRDGDLIADADVVVLAGALGVNAMSQAAWLPLEARRGQVSLVPTNSRAEALRSTLLFGGYLTPAHGGIHVLGATFDDEIEIDVRAEDHARNFETLDMVAPALFSPSAQVGGFAAVRCMSPDHLPIVGPMPERNSYIDAFGGLRHGHPWSQYPSATYQSGLYVMTALGARGLVSAPLAAEMLACHITGEPWPLERELVTALHPARFLVRELKRREV